ncbi:MAG: FtsX-like permease family protein, partial [Pseudomonadota bacterium]
KDQKEIENLVDKIATLEDIADVQYGQEWLGRFLLLFNLMRIVGLSLGGFLLIISAFIILNTAKLSLYSQRDELQIMRLVGATDFYIRSPFYIQGIIQGFSGGLASLGILYLLFSVFISKVEVMSVAIQYIPVRFLNPGMMAVVVMFGVVAGWIGSFFAVRKALSD